MSTPLSDRESRLATMAAKLLGIAIQTAQAGSDPTEVERAAAMHAAGKLYPRLTVTMPHGGSAARIELVLCDPDTDEPIVRMFECTSEAEGAIWAH